MNRNQKILTVAALITFVVLIWWAQWDMTNTGQQLYYTQRAPIFAPPKTDHNWHPELASSNLWTSLALGIVYAGVFAVLGKSRSDRDSKLDE